MTYAAQEASQQSGSPIELYTFSVGTTVYRFSSGEEPYVLDDQTYAPVPISRTTIVVSNEVQGEVISVTVPATTALVRRYINVVPGQVGTLTILRLHRTDVDDETSLVFKGLVRSVGFSLNGLQATINVAPINGSLSRTIPRFVYSGPCNNVLFDAGCKVNSNDFRYEGDVLTVSGSTLSIDGLSSGSRPNGWASGGFAVSPSGVDYRLILTHTGDSITLLLPFEGVGVGSSVEVFAGCGHDIQTCKDKFDNVINYGGFHWVPTENVFIKGVKGQ